MKIMPIEIRNQEFKKSMRGFDPVEVETFLDLVAGEYEELLAENERLQKQNESIEADLKHFREAERTLKQTLYNVQKTSQQSKENSVKEANLIKKEAQLSAIQLVERARSEVHKMQEEVLALKRQKDSLITRLKHILSSQIELLDVLAMDDALPKKKSRAVPKKQIPAVGEKMENVRNVKNAAPAVSSNTEEAGSPEIKMPIEDGETKIEKKAAEEPKTEKTQNSENKDDFFKDIFGSDTDIDEVLK
jgi:cell division initiation protein